MEDWQDTHHFVDLVCGDARPDRGVRRIQNPSPQQARRPDALQLLRFGVGHCKDTWTVLSCSTATVPQTCTTALSACATDMHDSTERL